MNTTRRDFFLGLVALGLAKGLPLPQGLETEVKHPRWVATRYDQTDVIYRLLPSNTEFRITTEWRLAA